MVNVLNIELDSYTSLFVYLSFKFNILLLKELTQNEFIEREKIFH